LILIIVVKFDPKNVSAWIIAGKLEVVVPCRIKRVVADRRFDSDLWSTLEIKNHKSIATVRIERDKSFRADGTDVDLVGGSRKRLLGHDEQ
jgi:hypothetical protein